MDKLKNIYQDMLSPVDKYVQEMMSLSTTECTFEYNSEYLVKIFH
jgi:hypothetical protein